MAHQMKLINAELERIIDEFAPQPAKLRAAMAYSLMAGGKRLRPILVLAATEAIAGRGRLIQQVLPAACAIECLHTYSLIHDDLPAMDDDDWRRGKATNHRVFGEGMAILAGDALLTLCFEVLAQRLTYFPAEQVLQVVAEVAGAAGGQGMVGGQAADILWEKEGVQEGDQAQLLQYIHQHKTGALIVASVRTGAILAGAQPDQLTALTDYAHALGLAFQITDDLLDIYGDATKLGKQIGQDEALGKLTYPAVHGTAKSKQRVEELLQQATASLTAFGSDAAPLRSLAAFLAEREY
ncbi:MAG: polyprenyl synthetase family protein [Firmicutes bacterium]|nr:polyprenyl synthetase family protein [Bacillota bacterium]